METNVKDDYKTKDLAEAGILVMNKQELLRIDREGRVCWFVFKGFEKCEQISNQFFFGQILVNAREYYETINLLKNRIFSTVNEYGQYRQNH